MLLLVKLMKVQKKTVLKFLVNIKASCKTENTKKNYLHMQAKIKVCSKRERKKLMKCNEKFFIVFFPNLSCSELSLHLKSANFHKYNFSLLNLFLVQKSFFIEILKIDAANILLLYSQTEISTIFFVVRYK